jgi:hypothetical protein
VTPNAKQIPSPSGQITIPSSPQQIVSNHAGVTYLALRQEVLDSGLWDEKWYLSEYYEHYAASKRRRARNELFFPLDYYLQEGWNLGHEPSKVLPIQIDQKSVGCSKIEYFLNRLRFDGYHFDENIWVPSEGQIRDYVNQKQLRTSKKVIYTCIAGRYDDLMQPYFISAEWDYVCFTDDPDLIAKQHVGVWQIRPMLNMQPNSVRANRWHKMHPHVLFEEYDESIYVDGNVNIISDYIFEQIAKREVDILLPRHFVRNCVYQEIHALLQRSVTSDEDKSLLAAQRDFLKQVGFPTEFGLSENNLIYRRHHGDRVLKLMHDWWAMYQEYSCRDQATLAYVFWRNGIPLRGHMFANCRVNYRDFWVMKHAGDSSARTSGNLPSFSADGNVPSLSPAFDRDNVAVVLSTNEQFIPDLGVAIFSLIENADEKYNYDIIILAKGLPDEAFAKVRGLANGHRNVSIRVYDTTPLIDTLPKDIFHVEGYVPVETYNKCFMTEILSSDYDRCVYLDSDILVLHDIRELHDIGSCAP